MQPLKQILFHRLEEQGIDARNIPGFIRSLAGAIQYNPGMNIDQVNQRLRYLGWDPCEMDYHTFQMAIACLEAEGLDAPEAKPPSWFEKTFAPAALQ
jgi:hypothetical protein